jgi:hypothetical protein
MAIVMKLLEPAVMILLANQHVIVTVSAGGTNGPIPVRTKAVGISLQTKAV